MSKSTDAAWTVYPADLIAYHIKLRGENAEARRLAWEDSRREAELAANEPPPPTGAELDAQLAAGIITTTAWDRMRWALERVASLDATIDANDRTIQALLEGRPLPNE